MGSSKWPYQELAQNLTSLSDEGLTREMSALETRYDGQFTLASQLIKPNYLCYLQFGSIKRNNASFFTVLCSITICYLSKEFLLTDPEKMLHEFNILVKKIRKIVNFNLSRRKKERFYWFCPSCVTSLSPPPPKTGLSTPSHYSTSFTRTTLSFWYDLAIGYRAPMLYHWVRENSIAIG